MASQKRRLEAILARPHPRTAIRLLKELLADGPLTFAGAKEARRWLGEARLSGDRVAAAQARDLLLAIPTEYEMRTAAKRVKQMAATPIGEPAPAEQAALAVPAPEPPLVTVAIKSARAAVDRAEGNIPAAPCPPEAAVPAKKSEPALETVEDMIRFSNMLRTGQVRPENPPEKAPPTRRVLSESFSREHETPPPARPAPMTTEEAAVWWDRVFSEAAARGDLEFLAKWFN